MGFEEGIKGKPAIEVTHLYSAGGRSLQEVSRETSTDEKKLRDFNKWLKTERIPADKEYAVLVPKGDAVADFGGLSVTPFKASLPGVVNLAAKENTEINGLPVIRANKGETLNALTKRGGVDISTFFHYNDLEIDKPIQAGQLYFLHKKKKRAVEELYTVKPDEDLWSISQRFGVQLKFLRKFNDLEENSDLS